MLKQIANGDQSWDLGSLPSLCLHGRNICMAAISAHMALPITHATKGYNTSHVATGSDSTATDLGL